MTPAAYPHEVPSTGEAAVQAAALQASLPRLETARLILRAPRIEDFALFGAILMSERAVHMGGPLDRRAAWLDFCQCVAGWHLRGHGLWTIEARDGGAVLGFIPTCFEEGDREPELGWFIDEAAEGRGIAFEAAQAVKAWALDTLALPALVSYIDPPNGRSVRLAERLGAWRDDVAAAEIDDDILVYRHAPDDADGGMEAYA